MLTVLVLDFFICESLKYPSPSLQYSNAEAPHILKYLFVIILHNNITQQVIKKQAVHQSHNRHKR